MMKKQEKAVTEVFELLSTAQGAGTGREGSTYRRWQEGLLKALEGSDLPGLKDDDWHYTSLRKYRRGAGYRGVRTEDKVADTAWLAGVRQSIQSFAELKTTGEANTDAVGDAGKVSGRSFIKVVVCNGRLVAELSDIDRLGAAGLEVTRLSAIESEEALAAATEGFWRPELVDTSRAKVVSLGAQRAQYAHEPQDVFVKLSGASVEDGLVLSSPAKCKPGPGSEQSGIYVQIIHVLPLDQDTLDRPESSDRPDRSEGPAGRLLAGRVCIEHRDATQALHVVESALYVDQAGASVHAEQADADPSEQGETSQPASLFIPVTQLRVGKGAELSHTWQASGVNGAGLQLGYVQAEVGEQARLHALTYRQASGPQLLRQRTDCKLIGEGAHAALLGLTDTSAKQHTDQLVHVEHASPNTTSDQLFKSVVYGESNSSFTGCIQVAPGATGTEAHQLSRGLMMSSDAQLNTRPRLRIDNDDVQCSHGASVSELEENELFYLATRGIKRPEARALLAHAFADEVLFSLPDAALRRALVAVNDHNKEKDT